MQLSITKDARYFQLLFQSVFLAYGILFLHWQAAWWLYATYFGCSILTHAVFEWWLPKKQVKQLSFITRFQFGLPSVCISSFGLCLLLKCNHWSIAALAAFISIASKYLLCYKGKHIFNPSAIGIVVTILFTGQAWFSPGQWGSSTVILFGVACLGFIVVTSVQKLGVSLAFLVMYCGLLFVRQVLYLQWPADFFLQSVSTGSLLLFSFFMISDPKTTPNHPMARMLWAAGIAVVAFYFATFQFMNGTPLWVMVGAQPLVPIIDHYCKAKAFHWYLQPAVHPSSMNKI